MEYSKPELTLIATASEAIQSKMDKGPFHWDQILGEPLLTVAAAYQSDE